MLPDTWTHVIKILTATAKETKRMNIYSAITPLLGPSLVGSDVPGGKFDDDLVKQAMTGASCFGVAEKELMVHRVNTKYFLHLIDRIGAYLIEIKVVCDHLL